METLEEIRAAISGGISADDAVNILTKYIVAHPDDDEALTERGLQYWRLGNRASAITDYNTAISINPDSEARQALQAANDILDFYNKDLYNP